MLQTADAQMRDLSGGGQPLLELRNVGKTFSNGVAALREVNLTIREGDFLSLLGPSGCGKSTALRLIAGLATPTTGALDWHKALGDDCTGFVFQEPTLLPWASVFDNVWLPLRLRGVSRDKAAPAVSELLERVHLTGFENAVPRELSGGMKMRVSIARALVTQPRLLLLELWQDQRFTVVFVTHSVFESVFLSNRIVVMAARPGRVSGEMTVDAAYPRDEKFRISTEYAAFCLHASEALNSAMNSASEPQ
jgi:NitT/TauT family transport system ATP-binding protein